MRHGGTTPLQSPEFKKNNNAFKASVQEQENGKQSVQAVKYRISLCVYIIIFRITHILGLRGCSMLNLIIIINYCCPVKPRLRDFSSRKPSKYGT